MAENDYSIGDGPTIRSAPAPGDGRRFVAGDTILGRYTVMRELGEGGMGVVYQCLDTVGGVEVAVKGLPPEVSRNEDEMDDIRANYQIVRKLRHPNIAGATTLEKEPATGDYYLVMDLASGVTLKRWMKRNPQATMETKLAILRQVAAALDYAHAEKVIHRDVKPENVMVDDDGRVKVLDFGLAAQIRSSQSRTSNTVSSKGGTPGYKSPEQWLGRPQQAPADVYAFGVLAYWLFSGHLPFDGDDPVVLGHAVLTAPVEPISDLPDCMNAALVKALAKKPEDRFTSCGALVAALEGHSAGDGRACRDLTGRAVAPRPLRGGVIAKILLAVAALALVAACGWWWLNGREKVSRLSGTTGAAAITGTAEATETTGTTGTTETTEMTGTTVTNVPPYEIILNLNDKGEVSMDGQHLTLEDVTARLTRISESNRWEDAAKKKEEGEAKPAPPRNGECREFTLPGGVKMEMVYVAPGSFTMVSSSGNNVETPHQVRITKPYWIGKYPVMQSQWKALVRANGVSFPKGEPTPYFSREGGGSDRVSGKDTSDFPMESISWEDCDALVKVLNRNRGATDEHVYSLPTEAQWEFAAKGGTKSRSYTYSGGNDMGELGWYYENSGLRRLLDSDWKVDNLESNKCRTHSVKEKDVGNELGIVGMSGNVWEWCNDWYYDEDYYSKSPTNDPQGPASGPFRVLRGGSWYYSARGCRSAFRYRYFPDIRSSCDGFRLCCSAGPRE